MHLSYKVACRRLVWVGTCPDWNNFSEYTFIKYSSGVSNLYLNIWILYISKLFMGNLDHFKGTLLPLIIGFESFIFHTNSVHISLPNVMLYLYLVESNTWNFYVTIFVALNPGRVWNILTFVLVVRIPPCVCHCIADFFIILVIRILIKIVELHQQSNKIHKFVNIALPPRVFIHPCKIGESWQYIYLCISNNLGYHEVNVIQLYYLVSYHVYDLDHLNSSYHKYFRFCFHMHDYATLWYCHQD